LNGAFCISTKNFIIFNQTLVIFFFNNALGNSFSEDELKQYEKLKAEISKLEQKQEKQEKDKNEITALKDKDLLFVLL
jgi:cell shape-determining protein MreC